MLIRFAVENWMSFRETAAFSMVASKERQHGDRVTHLKKYKTRVLPIAAIYGGNASGKTNLFKALSFAKQLVVRGSQPDNLIAVEPFRLDRESENKPTRFEFELLVGDEIYAFSFSVTPRQVHDEKLSLISSTTEKVLFERSNGRVTLDPGLTEKNRLNFAFEGTQDNQLFLTNSVFQKVTEFRPVYNWFKDTLELIAPDSRFGPFDQFFDEKHRQYSTMNRALRQLDTGITQLRGEEVPFDALPLPPDVKARLQEEVKDDDTVSVLLSGRGDNRFLVSRENGRLVAQKAVACHAMKDGTEIKFDIAQESDGSQRIIDLLPAFLDLTSLSSNKVYVIDEIDRSLHTLLTRKLIEMYLASCNSKTRTQLLLTTHDTLLMDQSVMRRDEMWVTERSSSGASTLYSFSDYKDVRYDKDIRKSYLQGRLGGIPRLLMHGALSDFSTTENSRSDENE